MKILHPQLNIAAIVEPTKDDNDNEGRITVELLSRAKLTIPDQAALKKRKSLPVAKWLGGEAILRPLRSPSRREVHPDLGGRLKSERKW
jgi:hypothetical protein